MTWDFSWVADGGSRLFPASAIHGRPLRARTPVPNPGVGRLRACRRHLNRLTGPGRLIGRDMTPLTPGLDILSLNREEGAADDG